MKDASLPTFKLISPLPPPLTVCQVFRRANVKTSYIQIADKLLLPSKMYFMMSRMHLESSSIVRLTIKHTHTPVHVSSSREKKNSLPSLVFVKHTVAAGDWQAYLYAGLSLRITGVETCFLAEG